MSLFLKGKIELDYVGLIDEMLLINDHVRARFGDHTLRRPEGLRTVRLGLGRGSGATTAIRDFFIRESMHKMKCLVVCANASREEYFRRLLMDRVPSRYITDYDRYIYNASSIGRRIHTLVSVDLMNTLEYIIVDDASDVLERYITNIYMMFSICPNVRFIFLN